MKVENKLVYNPILITLESEEEKKLLLRALQHAMDKTAASIISGPFGIPITMPCSSYWDKYKQMYDKLV